VAYVAGLLVAVGLACATRGADAHWLRPEQVIAELQDGALRKAYGITEVARHPNMPRLLVVRVGPGWAQLDPSKRRVAAEKWMARWRHVVPQGIIAILENGTDRSLVNFDAQGRAVLTDGKDGVSPPEQDP
jgi:hypothetical protein